jgi:hypothetical protein
MLGAACSPVVPQGQYGPYLPGNEKHLRLPSGQSLAIYRVKYWTFSSGDAPAMQFEYEALDPLADTAALRQRARQLWPAFAPYVEASGLRNGIITATKLERHGVPGFWSSTMKHFGLLVSRDAAGTWRFKDDGGVLPPADATRGPQIVEPTGAVMPFATKPSKLVQ